jgi:hypothetical protein
MSRFVPQTDMSGIELFRCYREAVAVLDLVRRAANELSDVRDRVEIDEIADDIEQATRLAVDLLEPVAQALETHEGLKSAGSEKSTG